MKKTLNKVVILGIDGLDPEILSKGLEGNLLPNFLKLKKTGSYSKLATTVPPQSPVAWASFTTGKSPAQHGVYDFIVRNPVDYSLDLVWSARLDKLYGVEPFWVRLAKAGVETKVLFLPNTFPPLKLNGEMMSGMGAPDLLGTAGKYSFYTSGKIVKNSRGNQIKLTDQRLINTNIFGPKGITIPLQIKKISKNKILIKVQNKETELLTGEFSDWVALKFKTGIFGAKDGIVKFYLMSTEPNLSLYMSPINIDPRSSTDISYPKDYSRLIAHKYGLFYTQGLPHDTFAYDEGVITDKVFLENAESIFQERKKIFLGELNNFKYGVFFNYVGVTDTIAHMFWGNKNTILNYYKKVDKLIGETLDYLSNDDRLIILSDHGFGPFDYEFNLNSWLKSEGFLTLTNGDLIGQELLQNIDWSKTKAYAVGYNSIYLNLEGREGRGIVADKDKNILKDLIKNKLLKVINPQNGKKLIKNIYFKKDLGIQERDNKAPDIFVGYYKGVRASWDTAVGKTPKQIFVKRKSKWKGDHLFDSTEVPGVLFSDKPHDLKNPKITDTIILVNKFLKTE
jgi:predicted AlkP superfamily phosphohydrolase/phosphomutase